MPIQNYNDSNFDNNLAAVIQTKIMIIIISSDERKSKKVSRGVWIIIDLSGNVFLSGTKPDFENINQIHSHRTEIYWVFFVLLFIQEYCKNFMLTFASNVEYYYDNFEVVHKINTLATVLKLREYLHPQITTFHVKGYQD